MTTHGVSISGPSDRSDSWCFSRSRRSDIGGWSWSGILLDGWRWAVMHGSHFELVKHPCIKTNQRLNLWFVYPIFLNKHLQILSKFSIELQSSRDKGIIVQIENAEIYMNQYPWSNGPCDKEYGHEGALMDVSLNIQPGRIIGPLVLMVVGKQPSLNSLMVCCKPSLGNIYIHGNYHPPASKKWFPICWYNLSEWKYENYWCY